MSNLAQDLAELLRDVRRPGDFFATGRREIFAPRLEVDGVGPIALPLLPAPDLAPAVFATPVFMTLVLAAPAFTTAIFGPNSQFKSSSALSP